MTLSQALPRLAPTYAFRGEDYTSFLIFGPSKFVFLMYPGYENQQAFFDFPRVLRTQASEERCSVFEALGTDLWMYNRFLKSICKKSPGVILLDFSKAAEKPL